MENDFLHDENDHVDDDEEETLEDPSGEAKNEWGSDEIF